MQKAIHHAPNMAVHKGIRLELCQLVVSYRDKAAKPALRLEDNVPEGLAVVTSPKGHRQRLHTSNPVEQPSNRRSRAAPRRCEDVLTKNHSSAWPAPSSSNLTTNG